MVGFASQCLHNQKQIEVAVSAINIDMSVIDQPAFKYLVSAMGSLVSSP